MKHRDIKISCETCSLAKLCLPLGLSEDQMKTMDTLITAQHTFERGEVLCHEGKPFANLFAVRSGSFKAYRSTADGNEEVLGFYLPGEIIGFRAIYNHAYTSSVAALETSSVCEIPFEKLLQYSAEMPELQEQLFALMSQGMSFDRVTSRNRTAEETVAAFLLNLSARFSRRGLSATHFILSMSRHDIANYLGLAPETVSRVLTKFQEEALIHVSRRDVELIDLRQLQMKGCSR